MTVKMPKAGLFDANGRLTAAGHKYLFDLGQQAGGGSGGGGFATADEPVYIEIPQDGTYEIILSRPFAGTINRVRTKTKSGSCTVALLVGGATIGSNNATTAMQTKEYSAAYAEGLNWSLAISFTAACIGLSVNIEHTRSS